MAGELPTDVHGSVDRLIAAYHETYRALDELPRVFWVPWRRERALDRIRALRVMIGCRIFLTPHVGARLDEMARQLNTRLALDPDDAEAKADLARIGYYRDALPRPPFKRLLAVYALLAAGMATLLSALLFPGLEVGDEIARFEGHLLSLDFVSAFDTARGDPLNALLALLLIGSTLAIIAAPLIAAFRSKRALLSLCLGEGDVGDRMVQAVRVTPAGGMQNGPSGVYDIEARTFERLGLARPTEFPYDLALYGLRTLILVPLWLGLAFVAASKVIDLTLPRVPDWTAALAVVAIGTVAPWRAYHFLQLYRERHGVPRHVSDSGFVAARTAPRVLAAMLDACFAVATGFVLAMVLSAVPMDETLFGLVTIFVLFPAGGVLVAMVGHWRGHQSLGKRIAGIEVVGYGDQARPDAATMLKRELVKWYLEIGLSFILLLPVLVTTISTLRDRGDRAFHDRVAGTGVRDAEPAPRRADPAPDLVARPA